MCQLNVFAYFISRRHVFGSHLVFVAELPDEISLIS
jgi:hypothetical protein